MSSFLNQCCPDECVKSLGDVDAAELMSRGFDSILLDLDNTLVPWQSSDLPASSKLWVETAKRLGMKVCILSNTHYPRRLRKIAAGLDIPSLDRAVKPRRSGFDAACKILDSRPASVVVIGDQILTDIIGGNRVGMHTILVEPMHPKEFVGTKLSRVVEWVILALLRRQGRVGTKSEPAKSQTRDNK